MNPAPFSLECSPTPSRAVVVSDALFGLDRYASGLYERLQAAVERQRHGMCHVTLEDLCGAIQLIQAGKSNLRDTERLDFLEAKAAKWPGVLMRKMPEAVFYGPEVSIRDTIDVSMADDPNDLAQTRREP